MKSSLRLCLAGTISAVSMFSGVVTAYADVELENAPRPANITLQNTDDGFVFADKNGMTIYTSDYDLKRGESRCTEQTLTHGKAVGGDLYPYPHQDHRSTCIAQHPAVLAEGKPVGAWTIIDRPDGKKQWAYEGRAVYTHIKDTRPGETNGLTEGRGGEGAFKPLAAPAILPPEVRIMALGSAHVLVTSQDRHPLYLSTNDPVGQSKCDKGCASRWHPLAASSIAKEQGGWTVVKRADSTRQWAFKGKPLYTYEGDAYMGDYKGNDKAGWEVALAYPMPKTPDVVKVVDTIIGPRYADSKGTTLYMWGCFEQSATSCDNPQDRSTWWFEVCGDPVKCADMWRPIPAAEGAKPVGTTWSVVNMPEPWAPVRAIEGQPGKKVWAYRGKPVFTYKFEDRPAMIDGQDIGVLGTQKWGSIEADGHDINQPQKRLEEVRAAAR